MKDALFVTMGDGSVWAVPTDTIIDNHASYYAEIDGRSIIETKPQYTIPLFEDATDELLDWAAGNMSWSDVESVAECISFGAETGTDDYEDGWKNGHRELGDFFE